VYALSNVPHKTLEVNKTINVKQHEGVVNAHVVDVFLDAVMLLVAE